MHHFRGRELITNTFPESSKRLFSETCGWRNEKLHLEMDNMKVLRYAQAAPDKRGKNGIIKQYNTCTAIAPFLSIDSTLIAMSTRLHPGLNPRRL